RESLRTAGSEPRCNAHDEPDRERREQRVAPADGEVLHVLRPPQAIARHHLVVVLERGEACSREDPTDPEERHAGESLTHAEPRVVPIAPLARARPYRSSAGRSAAREG